MKIYKKEEDMPIGEIKKEDGSVHHLICHGSRRHVSHWESDGEHCSEKNCEINYERLKRNNNSIK